MKARGRHRLGLAAACAIAWLALGFALDSAPADEEDRPKAGAPVVGGPRLDHAAHMARGMKCLDCHQPRKGQDDPLEPGPASLATCQECHADIDRNLPEAERVENVFFDEEGRPTRQKAVLSYGGDVIWSHAPHEGTDCLACHQDVMQTNVRRARFQMDMDTCMACHHEREADNSCAACHEKIRSGTPPRTHDAAWSSRHGEVVRARQAGGERDTCAWCHEEQYCTQCHQEQRPPSHGPRWLGSHGPLLRGLQREGQQTNCSFCHTESYCTTCHANEKPPSHDTAFYTGHGKELRQAQASGDRINCLFCHTQSSCDTCHETKPPPSHDAGWLVGHAEDVRSGGRPALDTCSVCHQDASWCEDCHQTKAPPSHAAQWLDRHGDVLAQGGRPALRRCAFCHQDQRWCDDCHLGQRPESHDRLWKQRHGDVYRHGGQAGAERCAFCHVESTFCEDCHRDEQPRDHTNLFRIKTHGLVAAVDRTRCQVCHETDFCIRCHEETAPMSHRAGWSGRQSRHCVNCHFPISSEPSCQTCHFQNPPHDTAPDQPPSHGPGLNCRLCHNSVGGGGAQPLVHPDPGISCELCHRR